MEYGKIIAVTGLPGLFELINSKNDGAIVRSLEDKTTKFISSRVHNFSHLESIEVFTVRDNVNLIDVFSAMDKEGGKIPDGKDGGELKKYFEKVYPDLDFERVYTSDLKKMVKWFEILKANNIEIKLTQQPEPEEEPAEVKEEKEAPKKTPVKKKEDTKPAPETAVSKAKAPAAETAEEKTKKAAAPKKKAEPKAEAKATASKSSKESKAASAPAKKAPPKKK